VFARTFAVRAKGIALDDPDAVISFVSRKLCEEIVGRQPFKVSLFADVDAGHQKIVFYDVSALESVVEFSSIYGRLPDYCVECDGERFKVFHFHPDRSRAHVCDMAFLEKDGRKEVVSMAPNMKESARESDELKAVVSSTDGLLQAAEDIMGKVVCSVVEHKTTKERRPFFTLKLDIKSEKYRAILRSCKRLYFAWSEDVSYMVLICRFKMLPAFALSLPVMGKNIRESMELYIRTDCAVGMVMYADDQSDAFTVTKGEPIFESQEEDN